MPHHVRLAWAAQVGENTRDALTLRGRMVVEAIPRAGEKIVFLEPGAKITDELVDMTCDSVIVDGVEHLVHSNGSTEVRILVVPHAED